MTEYTIHPLLVGVNQTDQGIMTYQRGYGIRIYLPIYAFYLAGGDQNIIIDTGLEDFITPAGFTEATGLTPVYFEDGLAELGLKPEEIDLVIQTHLHNDHCENTAACTKAKVVVQKTEWEFCQNPHPLDHRYFADLLDGVDLELVDGDCRIADGIELLFTPGHTPGGQSVAVNTAAGQAIITGFCCNDKNFPSSGPAVAPGVHTDALVGWDSANKIKNMNPAILIPLHDLGAAGKVFPE